MRGGFFTRQELGERKKARPRSAKQVSASTLRNLGPSGVRNMNPDACNPEMEPDGDPQPLVYVLGEAPGKDEDAEGVPFVGKSGRKLRYTIPRWGLDRTLFDNVVRTRPPENRDPNREEIECFRGVVEASIEKARPALIIGAGRFALQWVTGLTNISEAAGKFFPVQVGQHRCWFLPILHPAAILRMERDRVEKVPGDEWFKEWRDQIQEAYDFAEDAPPPEIG